MSYQDLPPGAAQVWRETATTVSALPATGAVEGEIRLVLDTDTLYEWNGSSWQSIGAPAGVVIGPGSSTDNAVARWDGTTGALLQNSPVTIGDTGNIAGLGTVSSGEVTSSTLTASRVLVSGASKEIQSSSVTTTELGYVSGVTSAIQTQLNAKQATGNYITALTSDVTASGPGSAAATIANDAVTYAKMQNVSATSRLLGRRSASAGDVEECTLTQALDFVGSPAQGDILYRNATVWTRLGAGTSGHFLKTQGAGADPTWAAATSTLDINGLSAADVALGDALPEYNASAAANRKVTVERVLGFGLHAICQGRLTTETGVPVSSSDRSSQGTIYFTPYRGNKIALYDGTRWVYYSFSEISLSLTATSGSNYDIFVYDNAGTLTLESLVWTNDTTRATAITTQDGIYVKSGATTRRYLGTFRASGSNVTESSLKKRFLWNYYNQVWTPLKVIETTDAWTSSDTSWHMWNSSSSNRVEFVQGINQPIFFRMIGLHSVSGSGASAGIGIDLDGNTANDATIKAIANSSSSILCNAESVYEDYPGLGYHYLQMMEFAGSALTAFYGDLGFPTLLQYGGFGSLLG